MSFNYFVSNGPYSYAYSAETKVFHSDCPWNYDDVTWKKETDPNNDGWYQKDPWDLCGTRHRMKIGIRGEPEEQIPFESAAIVSFRGKDTSGAGTGYHYDDTTKHKGTVKITWKSTEGQTKVIHDDSISGVEGEGDCPNENYKEYLFDRAGNYTIEACVGKASGSCAKPSGCIEYKLYVPEQEEEEYDYTPPADDGSDTDWEIDDSTPPLAGDPNVAVQGSQPPPTGISPMLIGIVGLGAVLILTTGKKKKA